MPEVEITIDAAAIRELGDGIEKAKRQLLGQMAERGYQLLRKEVPYQTGNLKQGVAPPEVDYSTLTATLTVSARSARRGSLTADVIGADGKKKRTVSLKAQPSFNYAEAVAKGRPAISPKNGRALLIPVPSAPTKGGYLLAGGQVFVVRKSARAVAPNPFDERAAVQLEKDAPGIAENILDKIFK